MPEQLAGVRIAVTAERRADELATLLERRGAVVTHAPAIHVMPLSDDSELRTSTNKIIDSPPAIVVISTGVGFRGWVEAADGWGIKDDLLEALGKTRIVARGPKARGAIRGMGLREEWSPATEASTELAEHLAAEGVKGVEVVVQLHGVITEWEPTIDLAQALADQGAEVRPISVYRWIRPVDQGPLEDLIAKLTSGRMDAISFTSAPAVASLLSTAKDTNTLDALLESLRSKVTVFCVGPVTSAPLDLLDVPTRAPSRARLGSLAKFMIDELSQ